MLPIPGPLGEGAETAAYSSGCGKATGRKRPLCATGEWGQGAFSQDTVLCPDAPPTPPGSPVPGGEAGSRPRPMALRGNESLSNQKLALRPFPERTSPKSRENLEETESGCSMSSAHCQWPLTACGQEVTEGLRFLSQGPPPPQNKATGKHKALTIHFLGELLPGAQEEGARHLCQDGQP